MKSNPYWIEGLWSGRLAILPRPRGDDWLEDEIQAWQAAGIDLVVSALEKEEVAELKLDQEVGFSQAHGLDYISFPITDRGIPSSARLVGELVQRLEGELVKGKNVAIHCRQGVGRSALLTACLLVAAGLDVDSAFERIQTARGCPVPDTSEQKEWVARFARNLSAWVSQSKNDSTS